LNSSFRPLAPEKAVKEVVRYSKVQENLMLRSSARAFIPLATCFGAWSHQQTIECDSAIEEAIGNTKLVYLRSVSEATGCEIYGKAEWLNPTGSVKDRAAKQIVMEAERSGLLKPGGTICEGTGGNTGIALAAIGAAKGYRVVICMPHFIAKEKQNLCRSFGAEVHLQPGVPFTNEENYAKKAAFFGRTLPNAIHTDQFENLANYRGHYGGTAPEIWNQTGGKVDAFVCAAGTGGTIGGISAYLKEVSNGLVKCFLIDPNGSQLFSFVNNGTLASGGGSSEIEGIGIGRLTRNFKHAELDGALRGSDQEAVDMCQYLMRNEGLCLGPSACLNVVGAVKVARQLGKGKKIVTILCDGGERYASKFLNDAWLKEKGLTPSAIQGDGKSVDFVL
jgi:cysteine synthase A